MPFRIINKDITTIKVDALVNSTNDSMIGFSGVDELIHKLGGEEFEKECAKHRDELRYGEAIYTNAYGALKCNYVIHTYGPCYIDGLSGESAILKSCYRESLRLASNLGCRSVAFPLICSGTMQYPIRDALGVAITAINEYLHFEDPKLNVILTTFGDAVKRIADEVESELDKHIKKTFVDSHIMCDNASVLNSSIINTSLETDIENMGKSFANVLRQLINEKGLVDPDVYNAVGISRQTFNKIINGNVRQPKKNTIVAMAFAMRLTYEEAEMLLSAAGFTFADNDMFDVITSWYLKNRKYNQYDIDTQLVKYGAPALFSEA